MDAGGSAGIKTRHLEGKHFQNETDDALYLNWRSGKDVHIGEATRPSNLWVNGDLSVGRHRKIYSAERLHIAGEESLYLLNKKGVIVSRESGGTGNLEIEGALITHPISNEEAKKILAGKPDGTAIVASAGGDRESRVDFYYKYKGEVHVAKLSGGRA